MDAALGLPSGATALVATMGAVLVGAVLVRVCRKSGSRAVLPETGVSSGGGPSTPEERLTTIRDLVALLGPPGGGKTTLMYEVGGCGPAARGCEPGPTRRACAVAIHVAWPAVRACADDARRGAGDGDVGDGGQPTWLHGAARRRRRRRRDQAVRPHRHDAGRTGPSVVEEVRGGGARRASSLHARLRLTHCRFALPASPQRVAGRGPSRRCHRLCV